MTREFEEEYLRAIAYLEGIPSTDRAPIAGVVSAMAGIHRREVVQLTDLLASVKGELERQRAAGSSLASRLYQVETRAHENAELGRMLGVALGISDQDLLAIQSERALTTLLLARATELRTGIPKNKEPA